MAKKERKRKQYDDDDGRTISNMNVDGMPWYVGGQNTKAPEDSTPSESKSNGNQNDKIQLTKSEQRAMMGGVMLASLLIAGVFIIVFTAFILFCVYVWFK